MEKTRKETLKNGLPQNTGKNPEKMTNNGYSDNISAEEMRLRLADVPMKDHPDIKRGFVRNFIDNVLQANEGCDLSFL